MLGGEPGRKQVEHNAELFLRFSFEVVAQLVVQLLIRLRPAKQRARRQRNREQPMLRFYSTILLYSHLRATKGSTPLACRAGTRQARSAIISMNSVTIANGEGSVGLIPYSTPDSVRLKAMAMQRPTMRPTETGVIP